MPFRIAHALAIAGRRIGLGRGTRRIHALPRTERGRHITVPGAGTYTLMPGHRYRLMALRLPIVVRTMKFAI